MLSPEDKNEVISLIDQRLKFLNETVNYFESEHPTMTTMEVARLFGKGRDWVIKRKIALGAKRVNRRGDLAFPTTKVLEYKKNFEKFEL